MANILLLALLAQAASPEIVVTGRKAAEPAEVQNFVTTITQRSDQQVARFHEPICPVVLGLPDDAALVIENRIRETATGIGARVSSTTRCDANLVLVIAEKGGDLVKSLRRDRPDWLDGLTPTQVRKLIAEPTPARAWAVTSLRNEDGLGMGKTGEGDSAASLQGVPMMRVMGASILKLPTRAQIEGSVIVIDRSAALGLSLAQLADYSAMRGLARTRPPSSDRIGTILGLFASGDSVAAPELTQTDIAYLQSLYRSPGTRSAVDERARIARDIGKAGR